MKTSSETEMKDRSMARERLADPEFISKKEYDRYIRRRLEKNDLCPVVKNPS